MSGTGEIVSVCDCEFTVMKWYSLRVAAVDWQEKMYVLKYLSGRAYARFVRLCRTVPFDGANFLVAAIPVIVYNEGRPRGACLMEYGSPPTPHDVQTLTLNGPVAWTNAGITCTHMLPRHIVHCDGVAKLCGVDRVTLAGEHGAPYFTWLPRQYAPTGSQILQERYSMLIVAAMAAISSGGVPLDFEALFFPGPAANAAYLVNLAIAHGVGKVQAELANDMWHLLCDAWQLDPNIGTFLATLI